MSPHSRLRLFAVTLFIASVLEEVCALTLRPQKSGDNQNTAIDDSLVDEAQYVMKIETSSEIAKRRKKESTKKSNQQTTRQQDIMSETPITSHQVTNTVESTIQQDQPSNKSIISFETTTQNTFKSIDKRQQEVLNNKNDNLNNLMNNRNVEKVELRTNGSNLESFSTAAYSNDKSSSLSIDHISQQDNKTTTTTFPIDMIYMKSDLNETTSKSTATKPDELKENKTEQSTDPVVGEQNELATTQASWEKYTAIERQLSERNKAVPASANNETDLAKADTAQSRVTLENTLNNSLTTPVDQVARVSDTTQTQDVEIPSLDVISSKRGGYLNILSSTMTTPLEMLDGDTQYIDSPEEKKDLNIELSRQLENDAIKEEMLREEMYMGNVKSFIVGSMNTSMSKQSTQNSTETSVEEKKLSVKPLLKNAGLFVVKPNYKPLKKIDVQPAKPFQRDPDDNSWRNESISSLGIVFKPKNSTKAFTEVLKNKTESELSTVSEGSIKNETPELRERLEKIAEVRKSKKKKVDKFGNTFYADYEESNFSAEKTNTSKNIPPTELSSYRNPISLQREVTTYISTTQNSKPDNRIKLLSSPNYDDTSDDDASDESEYYNLSNIDIKKSTERSSDTAISPLPILDAFTKPIRDYVLDDRKPTIQYFPPRQKQKPSRKEIISEDGGKHQPEKNTVPTTQQLHKSEYVKQPVVYTTLPPPYPINDMINKIMPNTQPFVQTIKPVDNEQRLRFTPSPKLTFDNDGYSIVNHEGDFNKASYVIKHYRDFEADAKNAYNPIIATHSDDDHADLFNDANKMKKNEEEYDYDKDVLLNKFVGHFNQNSERFKLDFPVLSSNILTYRKSQESGKYMKGIYDADANIPSKDCDAHCINVELSPAYELHYYVPEQEEVIPK